MIRTDCKHYEPSNGKDDGEGCELYDWLFSCDMCENYETMSYTVRYHPEGWRSAKDEPPEESGEYIVAVKDTAPELAGDFSYLDVMRFDSEAKVWSADGTYFNALLPDTPCGDYKLIAWQPFPTPPWEIMP